MANTSLVKAATSTRTVGPVDFPPLPQIPDRLVKIAPELAQYDQALRVAFEQLKKKFNEMENALRNS